MRRATLILCMALVSAIGLKAQLAMAHSVQTDYLLSPKSELSLDVTYGSGDPVPETTVKVYAPNSTEPWMEGKTDANGKFSFLPDRSIPGEWTVKIGQYDHADILKVPVDQKNGVDVDSISSLLDESQPVAANPTLEIQPAVAATAESAGPLSGLGDRWETLLLFLGTSVVAVAMLRRLLPKARR